MEARRASPRRAARIDPPRHPPPLEGWPWGAVQRAPPRGPREQPPTPGPCPDAGPCPPQGMSACEQIRAALYLECSAKFRENVEDVFREAAKVALSALKKAQRRKHRPLCLLL